MEDPAHREAARRAVLERVTDDHGGRGRWEYRVRFPGRQTQLLRSPRAVRLSLGRLHSMLRL